MYHLRSVIRWALAVATISALATLGTTEREAPTPGPEHSKLSVGERGG